MNEGPNLFLQAFLNTVVAVAAPLLVGLLAMLLRLLYQRLRMSLNAKQLAILDMLARQFVLAAEQFGLRDAALETGRKKKLWVMGQIERRAKAMGLTVDLETISNLIEAAVMAELTRTKVQVEYLVEQDDTASLN